MTGRCGSVASLIVGRAYELELELELLDEFELELLELELELELFDEFELELLELELFDEFEFELLDEFEFEFELLDEPRARLMSSIVAGVHAAPPITAAAPMATALSRHGVRPVLGMAGPPGWVRRRRSPHDPPSPAPMRPPVRRH